MLSFKVIENKAENILKDFNLFRAPIDIIELCKGLDIRLYFKDLGQDVSGLLEVTDEPPKMIINIRHGKNRQRFSIGHELGHFFLHQNRQPLFIDSDFSNGIYDEKRRTKTFHRNGKSQSGSDKYEIEANRFSASILMPEKLILKSIQDLKIDISNEQHITRISRYFKVSEQAMSFRISRLGINYI